MSNVASTGIGMGDPVEIEQENDEQGVCPAAFARHTPRQGRGTPARADESLDRATARVMRVQLN